MPTDGLSPRGHLTAFVFTFFKHLAYEVWPRFFFEFFAEIKRKIRSCLPCKLPPLRGAVVILGKSYG